MYFMEGVGYYSIARRCIFHEAVVSTYSPIIRCYSPTPMLPDQAVTPSQIRYPAPSKLHKSMSTVVQSLKFGAKHDHDSSQIPFLVNRG